MFTAHVAAPGKPVKAPGKPAHRQHCLQEELVWQTQTLDFIDILLPN